MKYLIAFAAGFAAACVALYTGIIYVALAVLGGER